MRAKVCHVSSAHGDRDIRILLKECVSLAGAGFEVKLVVPSSEKKHFYDQVEIISIKRYSRNLRMLIGAFQAALCAWKTHSTLYHFHDPELLPYALLFKFFGKRVVFDSHEDVAADILDKQWIPKIWRKLISQCYSMFEIFVIKRLDAIIGATPQITNKFSRLNVSAVTINNYPFLAEFAQSLDEGETNLQKICYIGGINRIRGLNEMIRAAELSDCNLVLAGAASNEDAAYIQRSSNQKISFLGLLDREQLRVVLQESLCGLVLFHPIKNHIEAQPNKLFEYMSAGLPVICSNFPMWKKLIEDNHFGICVDPLNVEEIASAIKYLLANKNEAKEMGRKGRLAIVEKYNWEAETKKLIQLYKQLVLMN